LRSIFEWEQGEQTMHKWIMSAVLIIASAFSVVLLAFGLPEKPKPVALKEGQELLAIEATNFEFNQKEYRVKAGTNYKITFKNVLGVHGVKIDGLGLELDNNNPVVEFTFDQPGEYKMFCSIMCGTGHGDMVAKLIVEA
jgi:cytochrome c oxidase subunit 2